MGKTRRTSRTRRKNNGSNNFKWVKKFRQIRNFIKKHSVALASIIIAVLTSVVIYYLSVAEPDLRIIKVQFDKKVELKRDDQGNIRGLVNIKSRFKNLSTKGGHIDRAEYIPISLNSASTVQVIGLNKEAINWGEEKEIEVRLLVTMDPDKMNSSPTDKTRTIELEQRFFDNTGKQITKGVHGEHHPSAIGFSIGPINILEEETNRRYNVPPTSGQIVPLPNP